MKPVWIDINSKNIEVNEDNIQYIYLFVGRNSEKLKASINFIHAKPQITSNILIKAILFEKSNFDLFANLIITKGAKETDAYLKIEVLLMSEKASATAIPSLEITEDAVKGGHGATIGYIDQEQLFYLQSKGISKVQAEAILALGFTQSIADKYKDSDIPAPLKNELQKLSAGLPD